MPWMRYIVMKLHTLKIRRLFIYFFLISALIMVIWKLTQLTVIKTCVDKLQVLTAALDSQKENLLLAQEQLLLLKNPESKNSLQFITIYAITPTYWRYVQKAELTRLSQTLKLIPNLHWIIIEDSDKKTDLVRNLIIESQLMVTHLNVRTPPFEKMKHIDPRWTKHRGVEQRNMALKWLRDNLVKGRDKGVVYFMDDDNTYSIKLFDEIIKVEKVGVWPVGLVGGLNVETPVLDPNTGKIIAYNSGWKPDRPFAIDMAGFAINLNLILSKQNAVFSYNMKNGFQESEFLSLFITKEELEPLADNCTQVYVWHTRTEKPNINGTVPNFEV